MAPGLSLLLIAGVVGVIVATLFREVQIPQGKSRLIAGTAVARPYTGFGATPVALESASFFLGGMVQRSAVNTFRLVRSLVRLVRPE